MQPNIAHKFGKASISTGYATATTVKTARLEGVQVLETYDLSDFAADTPVFFVTYKKTVDPVTNKATVTSQTSWKAIVNPDNNTLNNLTLAPGYEDIGNEVGDFVECIPTSFWGNELIEGLFVSMNPDGTLKAEAIKSALGITGDTPPDWTVVPTVPTVVSNDGQKQHKLRFTGVDYRPTLGVGTKLSTTRTGTTPTTSMSFTAASSQAAVKTSPTGMTFTDDFTAEAWVYLESYSANAVIARRDAAEAHGWRFGIQTGGQVELVGWNGGAGNVRYVYSHQVIPLNKWVHIAATLDMSGYTAATCKVYIDGVDVPAVLAQGGTNPTSLVNTGDLAVARNGTAVNAFFTGKIANARVWSTIRTAAQIRDNMNQETPASTTGLVGHWKGNGSWNDSSTNANHLTAVNSAVNNSATHPYSATEYAIITKVEYTASNTDVTVFTGNGCIPNETLGATSYSTARAPYGFPANPDKWTIKTQLIGTGGASGLVASGIGGAWGALLNSDMALPIGAWKRKSAMPLTAHSATSSNFFIQTQWDESTPSADRQGQDRHRANTAGQYVIATHRHEETVTSSALVTQKLYGVISGGAGSQILYAESGYKLYLSHECAYL